jgi:hypothetical protein
VGTHISIVIVTVLFQMRRVGETMRASAAWMVRTRGGDTESRERLQVEHKKKDIREGRRICHWFKVCFFLFPGQERDSRLSFTEQAADVASRLRRGEAELMGSRGSERG